PAGGYGYPKAMFIAQDKVEYGLRPGFQGKFDGVAFFNIPIEINATGFRDVPFGPKSSERLRVAVLGDSVVFGAGAEAKDRFTDLLRGKVTIGKRPAEFLNLGVNSYAFVHYLGQVERNFEGLDPDAVIIGFTLNDYQGFTSAWPRQVVQADERTSGDATLKERARRALATSYAGRFLTDLRDKLVLATMERDEKEAYHTKWMRKSNEQWAQPGVQKAMRQKLARMQTLLADKHIPVMYLVFPELNDVVRPADFGFARQTILAMLAEQKVPVCDPYPAFTKAPDPRALFLVNDSVHYTPAGHRVVADALAACLANVRWDAPARR
ncbi:MAG TPA: SGNH/GDSL hydrolase family protein, partial [bacterium]